MTAAHKATTLLRPPKAFEVDPSWYQSYWYSQQPQPELRRPSSRAFPRILCVAVARLLCSFTQAREAIE
jgi:hypothetical protein